MLTLLRFLLLLLVWVCPAWLMASSPLDHVRQARSLLGEETWSRMVQVENTNRRGGYPATVYALVFELGGLLWFYTDTDGTQSFSLHTNNLPVEKADFAPLLRGIDPGFAAHTILADEAIDFTRTKDEEPLPNGCLIESYAALRERMVRGELILGARLLSYHEQGRRIGHTVLTYETPAGLHVIDPARSEKPKRIKGLAEDDALALARRLRPRVAMAEARWVPMNSALETPLLAALGDARSRLNNATTWQPSRESRGSTQVAGS